MKIDSTCRLENFRRFLIISTCSDFISDSYNNDPYIFPERNFPGTIIVEAKDKETLSINEEIRFVRVEEVDRIIYTSKSKNTKLRWKTLKKDLGKVIGEASLNSLVNLVSTNVIPAKNAVTHLPG